MQNIKTLNFLCHDTKGKSTVCASGCTLVHISEYLYILYVQLVKCLCGQLCKKNHTVMSVEKTLGHIWPPEYFSSELWTMFTFVLFHSGTRFVAWF